MYHEEKIIDGVLCWRGTPNGEWTEYSAKQITEKFEQQRTISWILQDRIDKLTGV